MQLVNVNNSYFLKQNDTATTIHLQVLDFEGVPVNLTGKRVEVVIGNAKGRLMVKDAEILTSVGELKFGMDIGDILPAGKQWVEVHIYNNLLDKVVAPSKGYYTLRVEKSIDEMQAEISTVTLDYFVERFNNMENEISTKVGPQGPEGPRGPEGPPVDTSNLASKQSLEQVNQQLADIDDQQNLKRVISNDFIKYGKINIKDDLPEISHVLPFDLHRDSDGVIKHTFNIDAEIDGIGNRLYFSNSGKDTTGDGSVEQPFQSFNKVVQKATENGWSSFSALTLDKIMFQNAFAAHVDLSAFDKVVIRPSTEGVAYVSRSLTDGSFTQDGNSYTTAVSAVLEVLDIKNPDYRGLPQPMVKVNTKTECDNTKNSWFSNGSSIWCHTLDGRKPDMKNDILIIRDMAGVNFNLGAKCNLILKDLVFVQKGTGSRITDAVKVSGLQGSRLINYNIGVVYGSLNSIATDKIGEVYSFNCTTTLAGTDGFNYHGTMNSNPYEFAFEYNCHAYNHGLSKTGTNNATTAHDGMSIVRVNCVGYDSFGPVLADVNGCYSLNYDCTMYDARNDHSRTKSAYYFDEAGALKEGKAVLINCGGGGKNTFTVNGDGLIDIYVRNLKGNNIPESLELKLA